MKEYTYDKIPALLRDSPTWVLWRKIWREDKGKFDKVPTQVNGYPASITNRSHMSSFTDARFAYDLGVADGIGFCFTPEAGLVFIDLDDAVNCVGYTKEHSPIMAAFPTWGELSQSEKGVHLICKGTLDRARTLHTAGLEMYSSGRFVAMTGWALEDRPQEITNQQDNVNRLAAHIDGLRKNTGRALTCPGGPRPELVEMPPALESLTISRDVYNFLYDGTADKWNNDRSAAMFACAMSLHRCGLTAAEVLTIMWQRCGHIAAEHRPVGDALAWLWTYSVGPAKSAIPDDPDAVFEPVAETGVSLGKPDVYAALLERIRNLDKTDDQANIHAREIIGVSLKLEINKRIEIQKRVQTALKWSKADLTGVTRELLREQRGVYQSGIDDADGVYRSHIYIGSQNMFLNTRSWVFYTPAGLWGEFGHLDPDMREKALGGAGCAKVSALNFAPGEPEFFRENDTLFYNTWTGLADEGVSGDIGPWLKHLIMLVPTRREREHLLDWMACTLQRPDIKINHCIVMCGGFGQGKDTLWLPIVEALGNNVKQDEAGSLLRDFNEHLVGCKLFILQEADIGNYQDASRIANKLKPMLVSPPETLSINPKGRQTFDIRNLVHTVMFSNEQHPAFIKAGDRRYFVIRSDIRVTNIDGVQTAQFTEYFNALYDWLDHKKGYRHVIHYLLHRDLSQFNPKRPPPMTDAKQYIIEQGRSPLDSLMLNVIQMADGPFRNDKMTVEEVHQWLITDGSSYLTLHGIDRVPGIRAIGNALHEVGATQVRVRRMGIQYRVWDVAAARGAEASEAPGGTGTPTEVPVWLN